MLRYASENLRGDKDFMLDIISKYGDALKYASTDLKNDKDIVISAVSNDGNALKFASTDLKNDKEIAFSAVSNIGQSLMYVDTNLKDDKDIVLTAVNKNGMSLIYASSRLKDDKDVVLTSLSNYKNALYHASTNLCNGGIHQYINILKKKYLVIKYFLLHSSITRETKHKYLITNKYNILYKLNAHGIYNSIKFKNLIALYLDFNDVFDFNPKLYYKISDILGDSDGIFWSTVKNAVKNI
jgi:hypothetical protein